MRVDDHAGLGAEASAALSRELGGSSTLEDVLSWARALRPPAALRDVVVQDEYTHDVLFDWRAGLVLVFDTT